jgi:hypothetical protein
MKKWMIALLATVLVITNVSAENIKNTTYTEPEYKTANIDESLDFQASREWHKVKLEWNTYDSDDFKYYKVMRSETHSNPVYPDQPAIKVFDDVNYDSHEFENWSTENAIYRVCVITTDKSRICSNIVKLTGYVKENKEYTSKGKEYTSKEKEYKKTDYIKKEYVKKQVKKEYVKKQVKKEYVKKQVKKTEKLESRLQERADLIITQLIKKLDNKYGTDNESKSQKLSDLSTKLNKINDSITSEKTKALITYLIEALDKKKAEYGTSDDIEEIFNMLEK